MKARTAAVKRGFYGKQMSFVKSIIRLKVAAPLALSRAYSTFYFGGL